jgi:hypothetical protein
MARAIGLAIDLAARGGFHGMSDPGR